MATLHGRIEYPDDLRPGQSSADPAALSHLLFSPGESGVQGQAVFYPEELVDEPSGLDVESPSDPRTELAEREGRDQLLGQAAVLLAAVGVGAAAVWIAPKVRGLLQRVFSRDTVRASSKKLGLAGAGTDIGLAEDGVTSDAAGALEGEDSQTLTLTADEWMQVLALYFDSQASAQALLQLLMTTVVSDRNDSVTAMRGEMREMGPAEFASRINALLEANPSLLEAAEARILQEILGGGWREGAFMPVSPDRLAELGHSSPSSTGSAHSKQPGGPANTATRLEAPQPE